MILDRFIKIYSIHTDLTPYSILRLIEAKTKRQSRNILLAAADAINYRRLRVIDNSVELERGPLSFNPMNGTGKITFNLMATDTGTTIECIIMPSLMGIVFSFALLLLFLIIATASLFWSLQHIYFSTVIFMAAFWIVPLVAYYFSCKLNTANLDSYARLILHDLEILHTP